MKRKLGVKNNVMFAALIVLFVIIIFVFGYFISYELSKDNYTYDIASGSIIYDKEGNLIEVKDNGKLKRGFDRNYYLTYSYDNEEYKYKIGLNTIVYKEGDYRLYMYGTAYMVSMEGEVEKVTNQTEIIKSTSPYFFKISDRKYIFVDKKLQTSDLSVKTNDYLIIELDKQGNASFTNFENDVKTIKPLILKGTKYDFDIANEKLIISKEFSIDLKKVIGSTNKYVKKEEEKDENGNSDSNTLIDYYNDYFKTLKENFNNLTNSLVGMNDNLQNEINKEDAYLDLTRWTNLTSIKASISSITINYKVFDPNNEYSEIFVILQKGDESTKIQLSKANEQFVINNLKPDTEYRIMYGYRVVKAVGDDTMDIIMDNMKVATTSLNYSIEVTKITSTKINYKISFGTNLPDSCKVILYSDGNEVNTTNILTKDIDKEGNYTGSFDINTLGYIMNLRVADVVYDNQEVSYTTYIKFLN